jgi:hypothetical protein
MGPVWVDMFYSWKDQGKLPPSIKLALLAPGMPGQPMYYVIPAKAANPQLARDFIALATSPEVQAQGIVKQFNWYPGIDAGQVKPKLDAATWQKLFAEISPKALAKYGKSFLIAPTLTISKRVTKARWLIKPFSSPGRVRALACADARFIMSSSLKYLLLVAPAALMIAILFLYPLGFSLVSAFTAPGQPFTLDHFRKVYALYASDVLFSLLIVLISVALLALIAITLSAVIALSPCRPVVRLLGFLYRLPLFIPFIVVAQMMRTFRQKWPDEQCAGGGRSGHAAGDALLAGMERIIITFVWKQLAFATLLICGRWRRWSVTDPGRT